MSDPRTRGIVLIVNPRSTRYDRATIAALRAACEAFGPTHMVDTAGLDTALAAARQARDDGAGVVAVAGGDGTVAEMAGILAGSPTGLLPIPAGSTNVFARALGWPAATRDVAPLLAGALAAPRRTLRLGSIATDGGADRTFCVNAGVGMDAATVDWIEAHPAAKRRFRQLAFAAAAAGPGLVAFLRRDGLEVAVDGTPGVRAATFMAACGHPYAYVGSRPLELMPHVDWDGALEWLAMTRALPVTAGAHVLRAVSRRGLETGRALMGGVTRGEIVVTTRRPVHVQADGEALGTATHVRLTPGPPIDVVVPAG